MAQSANPHSAAAIERQAQAVRAAQLLGGEGEQHLFDREFAALMTLLAPRIRHLIRVYRLTDMIEDAEQVCAIAVLRALDSYDPQLSHFATHVTWQLRGELQSLRHRVRLDQRRSARTAGITTVAIESLTGEGAQVYEIIDEHALQRTEAGACEAMTLNVLDGLLEQIGSPEHERDIVLDDMLQRDRGSSAYGLTREQRRQVVRRTWRNCAKIVAPRPH